MKVRTFVLADKILSNLPIEMGKLVATPGALSAMGDTEETVVTFVRRHVNGDWGDLSKDDNTANERAVLAGGRILSAYHLKDGTKIWIITEADRSSTCVLLPEEY